MKWSVLSFRENLKELTQLSSRLLDILDYVRNWSCGSGGSALICLNGLVQELADVGILQQDAVYLVGKFQTWSTP